MGTGASRNQGNIDISTRCNEQLVEVEFEKEELCQELERKIKLIEKKENLLQEKLDHIRVKEEEIVKLKQELHKLECVVSERSRKKLKVDAFPLPH